MNIAASWQLDLHQVDTGANFSAATSRKNCMIENCMYYNLLHSLQLLSHRFEHRRR